MAVKTRDKFIAEATDVHGDLYDYSQLVYINSLTKVGIVCKKHGIFWQKPQNHLMGKGCKKCAVEERCHTHAEVKQLFQEVGCELLEVYRDRNMLMRFRCSCGEISHVSLVNFLRGGRCKRCRYGKTSVALRTSYEKIRKYFAIHDCELLEVTYTNAHQLLKYRCKCGRESKICFDSFKHGNRCRECGNRKISKKIRGKNHPSWIKNRKEAAARLIFRKKCNSLLKNVLRRVRIAKDNHTRTLLGYGTEDLRRHFESHPNWKEVSKKKWHIDHIFPVRAFLDRGIKDMKLINCLENLQPLSVCDNMSKHDAYDSQMFEKWLKQKGVILCPKL